MAFLRMNKGSDMTFGMVWYEDQTKEAPFDLTGLTVSIYDEHPALTGHLSVTVTNAETGEMTLRLDWQDDMQTDMRFRVMLDDGADQMTTPEIVVMLQ